MKKINDKMRLKALSLFEDLCEAANMKTFNLVTANNNLVLKDVPTYVLYEDIYWSIDHYKDLCVCPEVEQQQWMSVYNNFDKMRHEIIQIGTSLSINLTNEDIADTIIELLKLYNTNLDSPFFLNTPGQDNKLAELQDYMFTYKENLERNINILLTTTDTDTVNTNISQLHPQNKVYTVSAFNIDSLEMEPTEVFKHYKDAKKCAESKIKAFNKPYGQKEYHNEFSKGYTASIDDLYTVIVKQNYITL